MSTILTILAWHTGQSMSPILLRVAPSSGLPVSMLSDPPRAFKCSCSRRSNQIPLQLVQRSTSMEPYLTFSIGELHFGQSTIAFLPGDCGDQTRNRPAVTTPPTDYRKSARFGKLDARLRIPSLSIMHQRHACVYCRLSISPQTFDTCWPVSRTTPAQQLGATPGSGWQRVRRRPRRPQPHPARPPAPAGWSTAPLLAPG
jgi:hypothetical protein